MSLAKYSAHPRAGGGPAQTLRIHKAMMCPFVERAAAMAFYVYMLCNKRNGTLYIGMTDNLVRRVWQHREGLIEGFTTHYGLKTLLWLESHESRESAFTRERQMKKWNRAWKLRLIEQQNPEWRDLWDEIAN